MTCFDSKHYAKLKKLAKQDGLRFVCTEALDTDYTGVVVVYPSNPTAMRMLHVAVSYCSPEDKYKKKHGKYQALLKYFSMETVQLPLGTYVSNRTLLKDMLRNSFCV